MITDDNSHNLVLRYEYYAGPNASSGVASLPSTIRSFPAIRCGGTGRSLPTRTARPRLSRCTGGAHHPDTGRRSARPLGLIDHQLGIIHRVYWVSSSRSPYRSIVSICSASDEPTMFEVGELKALGGDRRPDRQIQRRLEPSAS